MESGPVGLAPLYLLVFVLVFGLVLIFPWSELWRRPDIRAAPAKGPRPLKPKTGADCPSCRAEPGTDLSEGRAAVLPRPWREGQSPRGRKKASRTRGFAYNNRACVYYGITGLTIHALVTDGQHTCTGAVPKGPARCQCGKHERIQDLKCQACGHKFTVRRHTVLYRLKTHAARVAEALTFLAEGMDLSVMERVWQMGEGTLRT